MRRITLWLLSTVSVLVLLFGYHTSTDSDLTLNPPTSIVTGSDTGSTSPASSAEDPGATTVTGDAVSTQWGPVQVQLTIEGGEITAVDVVQYPQSNHEDVEINSYAIPVLVQETLDQQSPDIDMVSGATVTSTGYVQSLQSALDRAGL